jgi:hypothetical protein
LYSNNMIDVFYLYIWFFTNLLVYMTYGGGMPLMYLLGFIHFALGYLAYKYLFIDYHRKSYGFDETIPLYAVSLMKWPLFFHLLIILFVFTNKRLLTPKDYDTEQHYRPPMEPADQFFERRFDNASNQLVLYVVVIILVVFVLWKYIILTIYQIFQVRRARRNRKEGNYEASAAGAKDKEEFQRQMAEDYSDDIFKEFKVQGLKDLYIRALKEQEQFRTMLNALSYD